MTLDLGVVNVQFKVRPALHYGDPKCPVPVPENFPKASELLFDIEILDFYKVKVRNDVYKIWAWNLIFLDFFSMLFNSLEYIFYQILGPKSRMPSRGSWICVRSKFLFEENVFSDTLVLRLGLVIL